MNNSALLRKAISKGLKILFFDIETSPLLVWTYQLYDCNIPANSIEQEGKITSIAYRFEGDKGSKALEWDWDSDGGNDSSMLTEFATNVLSKADLVIAQNGDRFDLPVLNWRLNVLGLQTPNPSVTLDTLKLSRKVFKPPSHKLDYRSSIYGYGGKIKQDMADCIAVAKGDMKISRERVRYNLKDTDDLRKIFWRELDAYILPKSIVKMLKEYVADPRPFCIKCAARRQKRFEVAIIRKQGIRYYECNNCNFIWKLKEKK